MQKIEVSIRGTENKTITLDYRLPIKIKGPTVLYAHGFNGFKDWGGMDLVADEFAEKGMPCVKFNFSHNGTSPENLTEFVDTEAYSTNTISKELNDLYIVCKWINNEFAQLVGQKQEIVLIGHSKGGSESILFTALKRFEIHKLITLAAPARADIPWHSWPKDRIFAWNKTGIAEIENKRTNQKLPLSLEVFEDFENHKKNYNVLLSAHEVKIPWLICHGDADETADVENAHELHKANPSSELLILKNAGHSFNRSHPWKASSLPDESKMLIKKCIEFAIK